MASKLKKSYQVQKLAADLGLPPGEDPVGAILLHCERKPRQIARRFGTESLSGLLDAAASALGTHFLEVHTDADLREIQQRFLRRGEKAFVTLGTDLAPDVYAITFKLTKRKSWQQPYVSVIDCRGDKAARAYFSMWHELAHLLTLTDQMRLAFTRTHVHGEDADPEEALMEVIAGKFGFWDRIIGPDAQGEITFDGIDRLRARHCASASYQASLIGFVRAWRSPCVLVLAGLGLKKSERDVLDQESFNFVEGPVPQLRALKVTASDSSRGAGIVIFQNMRVPQGSVVHRVFFEGIHEAQAVENLEWWTTSVGEKLADLPVVVRARKRWECVEALIAPAPEEPA